jgi:hypothetical protein
MQISNLIRGSTLLYGGSGVSHGLLDGGCHGGGGVRIHGGEQEPSRMSSREREGLFQIQLKDLSLRRVKGILVSLGVKNNL